MGARNRTNPEDDGPFGPRDPGAWTRDQLERLASALVGDPRRVIRQGLLEDPRRARELLERLVEELPGREGAYVQGRLLLDAARRHELVLVLSRDEREAVREALYDALAPPRLEIPGRRFCRLREQALQTLVRQGIEDVSDRIRADAIALAFDGDLGWSIEAALIAETRGAKNRWRALLALGSARTEASLRILLEHARSDDLSSAAAAVRALAQREDGAECFWEILQRSEGELWMAAVFALANVVRVLSDEHVAWLGHPDRPPEIQQALSRYLDRTKPRNADAGALYRKYRAIAERLNASRGRGEDLAWPVAAIIEDMTTFGGSPDDPLHRLEFEGKVLVDHPRFSRWARQAADIVLARPSFDGPRSPSEE